MTKPIDGTKKLSKWTLQEAVDSAYAVFAAVLRARGEPGTPNLYEEEIPGMVFAVAIGAGWLPVPDEKPPQFHSRNLVPLGDSMVEPWYKDAFIALLENEIMYHTHSPTATKERMESLPHFTTKAEREELLQQYLATHSDGNARILVTEVAKLAGVDYADFRKWRNGPPTQNVSNGLPDSSIKAKRIAIVLRYDDRSFSTLKRKSKWWDVSPS